MRNITLGQDVPGRPVNAQYYKKAFWRNESSKFSAPHYRLQKSAQLVNKTAGTKACTLLDLGCGPATFQHLLRRNINYYGIDIAIVDPAPNLLEVDMLEAPIRFGDRRFDIVIAQGLFEYLGAKQSQKFAEIAQILREDGTFIVSYTNFGHLKPQMYEAYSNVQPLERFRESLLQDFVVRKAFPTSHNWSHGQPTRRLVKAANMYLNANIPFVSPLLAVEYFFVCTPRRSSPGGVGPGPGAPRVS